MDDSGKYIVWVIPFFFLLIGLEILVAYRKKGRAIRMNDSVTNLQVGLSEQLFSVLTRGAIIWVYSYLLKHFAFFQLPSNFVTFLVLLFLFDFVYYWAHRLSHEINFMWATHIVHHSSQEYNLSVALRQPWFQTITTSWLYLPIAFLGFPLELFIAVTAIDLLYQFWIHTEYVPKMGKVIEFVLNTPSHHRVHHGTNPKYLDKNHAGIFIIWDRMFGTFQEEEETPEYGITTGLESYNPLYINTHYWGELWKGSGQIHSLFDKIKLWFMPPGWRPKSQGGRMVPTEKPNLNLYNVRIHKTWGLYLGTQFVFISAFALWIIWNQNQYSTLELLGFIGISIFQMSMLGWVFEQRKYAAFFDLFRLMSMAFSFYFIKDHTPLFFLSFLGIYWLISFFVSVYILVKSDVYYYNSGE